MQWNRDALGGCIPPRGPMPGHQGDATHGGHSAEGQWGPYTPQSSPSPEALKPVVAARGPVRTRPASSRQTCWRHIPPLKRSSSPAPPLANHKPHTGATAGCSAHWPACPPPPAPVVRVHPGQDPEVLPVAASPGCSDCSSTSCRRAELGQNRSVQAQCGKTQCWAGLSRCLPWLPSIPPH